MHAAFGQMFHFSLVFHTYIFITRFTLNSFCMYVMLVIMSTYLEMECEIHDVYVIVKDGRPAAESLI